MDAIVLAGGLGTRLRSVVKDVPKCMAPVAGRPFLYYILEYLKAQSVDKVVLSLGYLSEVVLDWIDTIRSDYPFQLSYVIEKVPLGTGGGIRLAMSECSATEVLVLNGDTMFAVPANQMLAGHKSAGRPVTLALKPMQNFDRYGTVCLDGALIKGFAEKQHCENGLINGGVYLIDREADIFEGLPEAFSFEKAILEPMSAAGKLSGVCFDSYFIDIGIPDDYDKAQKDFSTFRPWLTK